MKDPHREEGSDIHETQEENQTEKLIGDQVRSQETTEQEPHHNWARPTSERDKTWIRTGPDLDQRRTRPMSEQNQFWIRTGQDLDQNTTRITSEEVQTQIRAGKYLNHNRTRPRSEQDQTHIKAKLDLNQNRIRAGSDLAQSSSWTLSWVLFQVVDLVCLGLPQVAVVLMMDAGS